MNVKDIMTTDVKSCTPDTTVAEVVATLQAICAHQQPIQQVTAA